MGVGGDVNLGGSAGQVGMLNNGGMGGGAPMGGSKTAERQVWRASTQAEEPPAQGLALEG